MRDDRWKLVEYFDPAERVTQLFDLQADPLETANLASAPAMEEEVSRLRGMLGEWQRRVGDEAAGTV